jgi:transcriptional regulator with XRE-family HTH domain
MPVMSTAPSLLRDSRIAAGLTQQQLAERLGTSQSQIARLERSDANPRIETLERAIAATGHRLQMFAPTWGLDVDASLVRSHLERTPRERLDVLDSLHSFAERARRARRV